MKTEHELTLSEAVDGRVKNNHIQTILICGPDRWINRVISEVQGEMKRQTSGALSVASASPLLASYGNSPIVIPELLGTNQGELKDASSFTGPHPLVLLGPNHSLGQETNPHTSFPKLGKKIGWTALVKSKLEPTFFGSSDSDHRRAPEGKVQVVLEKISTSPEQGSNAELIQNFLVIEVKNISHQFVIQA
jgi:hypothetical protein